MSPEGLGEPRARTGPRSASANIRTSSVSANIRTWCAGHGRTRRQPLDICFRKGFRTSICPRKYLAAFTLPQEPRARTGPATISSILCIVYLPRWKGAAAKCSFRCRAFRRWGLRWPCCASSRTVLSSLSVQCSLGAEAYCKANPWCATAVITDSRPPAQGDSAESCCHRPAGRHLHLLPPCWSPPSRPDRFTRQVAVSPEGLGEPRARTGPRKECTHCLSLVLVPWPRDYCIGCTIQSHRDLLSAVFSARAFAWRLRLRVSR